MQKLATRLVEENLLVKELRTISLNDSLVALLSLQNALIIASGSEMRSMLQLTSVTSAVIWCTVVVNTVMSFICLSREFAGIKKTHCV